MGWFGRSDDDDNIREALDRCRQREEDECNERARQYLADEDDDNDSEDSDDD